METLISSLGAAFGKIIEALASAIRPVITAVCKLIPAYIKLLCRIASDSKLSRIIHLSKYAKKKRVRKKNRNRLKKLCGIDLSSNEL